jgi:2-methylisocitrate lyase-like PEP mutase family enzyme
MTLSADHVGTFRALHVPGRPLLMPNPWDAGTAKLLASLGFHALATTSSGHAATLGRPDGAVTRDEALAHAASIVAAVAVPVSADRVAAAADAARTGTGLVLTARAENYLRGNPDLADTIARLQAYQEAGAEILYAPGLTSFDDIRTVIAAVDRPVNVLAFPGEATVAELAELGWLASRSAGPSTTRRWQR